MKIEDIKYKAYVKELNKIFNVELMELCNTCGVSCVAVAHNSTDDLVQYDTDEVILLPFTGFKTTGSGLELYEHDLIKVSEMVFEIKYSNQQIMYYLTPLNDVAKNMVKKSDYKLVNGLYPMAVMPLAYCEVLGNRFENPELLKE